MKKTVFSLFVLILAAAACQKDIPVADIRIEPASATLFVGESVNLSIQCSPEEATNVDELTVYSTNESIVSYSGGVATARDGGSAAITASCGSVLAQCRIKVYKDSFSKGGKTYGIDYGTGYLNMESEASPQSIEIDLIHEAEPRQTFQMYLRYPQLGQDLDFTKPLSDAFVSVFAGNNEDGYSVFAMEEGGPLIVTADFSDAPGVTLVKGNLRLDQNTGRRYKVHADFELSNGYRFFVDWEGIANLTVD